MAPRKHKGKEKVLEPIVESFEHIDFHFSFQSNGDVHSLIFLLNGPKRGQGGKQVLKRPIVDESLEKQKEEVLKVEKLSKKFLALVEAFCVFVVQQGEAIAQNQEMAKLMSCIAEGLGAIGSAQSGGFAKATITARLPNSFVGKEIKTKWVWSWLHEVEAHVKTQCLKIDKERIHFAQTLLKEHAWEWWMSQKQETTDPLETFTWEEFKL